MTYFGHNFEDPDKIGRKKWWIESIGIDLRHLKSKGRSLEVSREGEGIRGEPFKDRFYGVVQSNSTIAIGAVKATIQTKPEGGGSSRLLREETGDLLSAWRVLGMREISIREKETYNISYKSGESIEREKRERDTLRKRGKDACIAKDRSIDRHWVLPVSERDCTSDSSSQYK